MMMMMMIMIDINCQINRCFRLC